MDRLMTEHSVFQLKTDPGMPARAPLDMPVQDLARAPERAAADSPTRRVVVARFIAFGGAALLSAGGAYEMTQVVSVGGVTLLEAAMTILFALTFAWIALAATSALAGALASPARHVRLARTGGELGARTALVMPIYHEDPAATTAALEAMARGLAEAGEAAAFEIVVLSDSTDGDAWVRETAAVERLRKALADVMPVWYRRRWSNSAKKAGNIKDFVEQWGGRYDHFIILDADSLMAPETLITLAAAMEADPGLGILQTVPVLTGGRTLFARLQQFAGRVHGPIVARGLAAWQGSDGNYWGHNAIIRTRAFAGACGLPTLSGRQPFGGPILSHDFVEAALIRRAGWRVEMTPRLGGSWEESPPSLIDAAVRDRRWAQGNLQHAKVIGARGLAPASRMHLAIGIMSYLSSPLWLLLIGFGFALSLQARLIRPEYFPDTFQLFPTWPHFDSERMIRLFVLTLLVLFLPKLMGLARALARPELRRGCGGGARLVVSFFVEVAVSALLAPIMMAIHSRQIYEILIGRDAGWERQRRAGGETSWNDAWRRHRWHMACGVTLALAAWFLSPAILAWLSPTLAGLILAAPLSRASGSERIGDALQRAGILTIPEEAEPHPIFRRRDEAAHQVAAPIEDGITALATDGDLRTAHFGWVGPAPHRRGAPEAALLTAAEKVREARSLAEALAWLDRREGVQVAGQRALAEALARLPRGDDPGAASADTGPGYLRLVDPPPEPEQIRPPAA
jgi:membrane glycosyltransferase